jgi:hypothetical protein
MMARRDEQEPTTPNYRRRWLWFLTMVALLAITAAACGSTPNSASTTTTSAHSTTTTASAAAPTTASPPSTAPPLTNAQGAEFEQKYGAFAAITDGGSSDGYVPIPSGAKAGIVTATYSGSSNFQIVALDGSNEMVDLLVNRIGPYSGTTAFGFGLSAGRTPVVLSVTASGPWTLKVASIVTAPVLPSPAQGQSDAVYLWTGRAASWSVTHQGQGNFIVRNYASGSTGLDLLVNVTGPYNATKAVEAGPRVTIVEASGPWSITY